MCAEHLLFLKSIITQFEGIEIMETKQVHLHASFKTPTTRYRANISYIRPNLWVSLILGNVYDNDEDMKMITMIKTTIMMMMMMMMIVPSTSWLSCNWLRIYLLCGRSLCWINIWPNQHSGSLDN